MSTEMPRLAPGLSADLIRSIPEGIIVLDAQTRVTYLSPGAEAMTGWQAQAAQGQPIDALLPLAMPGELLSERFAAAAKSPQKRLPPVDVLRPDGQSVTLSISYSGLESSSESPAAASVLVLRDVTETNAARQVRSYFLANISHEFRTPLSALKASVELLLDDAGSTSPAELESLLNSIHLSVTGLQTLIDNLLESVSIESGHFRVRPRQTDLGNLVAEAGKVMRPLLARRGQTLSVSLPPGLPRVNVDPMRLTQVLVNLLSNASKYGPLDKPIALDLLPVSGAIKVSVSDQGSGIAPAERANIFRRFVRLKDEKDKAQFGIGLGLSVVKTIIEEHGGTVGLDERPGGGSIFWFTIPLEQAVR